MLRTTWIDGLPNDSIAFNEEVIDAWKYGGLTYKGWVVAEIEFHWPDSRDRNLVRALRIVMASLVNCGAVAKECHIMPRVMRVVTSSKRPGVKISMEYASDLDVPRKTFNEARSSKPDKQQPVPGKNGRGRASHRKGKIPR